MSWKNKLYMARRQYCNQMGQENLDPFNWTNFAIWLRLQGVDVGSLNVILGNLAREHYEAQEDKPKPLTALTRREIETTSLTAQAESLQGTNWPGENYEAGVFAALEWVLGEGDDPLKDLEFMQGGE